MMCTGLAKWGPVEGGRGGGEYSAGIYSKGVGVKYCWEQVEYSEQILCF